MSAGQPRRRLLALDMDGTLLDGDKRITDEVRRALAAYLGHGGLLTIASGRFPASVWLHARELEMNVPLIALNGAVMLDQQTGGLLQGTPIEADSLISLIRLVQERGAYVHLYGCNELYVERLNEMNARWPLANVVVIPGRELTESNYREQTSLIRVIPVGDLASFAGSDPRPVYKATVICDNPGLIDELLDELAVRNAFALTRTGRRRFDVNASGVSKRTALELLCRERGIRPEEVAAIGDYDNDIEMLRWAGLGIAMGNAEERVKRVARAVTGSNRENGVARAVWHHLIDH
jgi:Cof subfamily protein (haloacid dehalogenase superfamily)